MEPVPGFTKVALAAWASRRLQPECDVYSDGLGSSRAVGRSGARPYGDPIQPAGGRPPNKRTAAGCWAILSVRSMAPITPLLSSSTRTALWPRVPGDSVDAFNWKRWCHDCWWLLLVSSSFSRSASGTLMSPNLLRHRSYEASLKPCRRHSSLTGSPAARPPPHAGSRCFALRKSASSRPILLVNGIGLPIAAVLKRRCPTRPPRPGRVLRASRGRAPGLPHRSPARAKWSHRAPVLRCRCSR